MKKYHNITNNKFLVFLFLIYIVICCFARQVHTATTSCAEQLVQLPEQFHNETQYSVIASASAMASSYIAIPILEKQAKTFRVQLYKKNSATKKWVEFQIIQQQYTNADLSESQVQLSLSDTSVVFLLSTKASWYTLDATTGKFEVQGSTNDVTSVAAGTNAVVFASKSNAKIFVSGKGTWSLNSIPAESDSDQFGASSVISGDYIAIGAPGRNSSTGAVYLYSIANGFVTSLTTIGGVDQSGEFGTVVSLTSENPPKLAVLCKKCSNSSKQTNGAIYLYQRETDSYWHQSKTWTASDSLFQRGTHSPVASGNAFYSIATHGDAMYVGHEDSIDGALYIMKKNSTTSEWTLSRVLDSLSTEPKCKINKQSCTPALVGASISVDIASGLGFIPNQLGSSTELYLYDLDTLSDRSCSLPWITSSGTPLFRYVSVFQSMTIALLTFMAIIVL